MEENNANYQKGFNEGYFMTKHMPELSAKLSEIKSEAPHMEGFRDGREQFIMEKTKDRTPQWLKKEIPGKEQSKTKEDREPEKE